MTSSKRPHNRALATGRQLEPRSGFQAVKPRDYGTAEDVARRAVNEAGGARDVARLFDISEAMVYAWTDPQCRGDLSVSRALRLTRFKAVTAFAEAFAGAAGGVFIPADCSIGGESIAELGVQSNREMAELIGGILAAVADGRVTDRERKTLLRELDDVLRSLCRSRAKLMEMEQSGGTQ